MSFFPSSLENLIEAFASLPGIGKKSAQRLAFYLLAQPDEEAKAFADAIVEAKLAYPAGYRANDSFYIDALAWYNLVHGRDWCDNLSVCTPIKEWSNFTGDPALEGNDLCLEEAVSLINYLAEQYGHDKVAAFCFETCSFEEAFGTDFATARAAWEQSLMERFGDGSEEPAEQPQVSFDESTKTLRVVGTDNYELIDLSRLSEATTLIVEDDDFSFSVNPSILYSEECEIKDYVVDYLPGYLERVDKSLETIRQFVADNAPNDRVIAQTQKTVMLKIIGLNGSRFYNKNSQIEVDMGKNSFRWHGIDYTLALLNPRPIQWQHYSYAYWVGLCIDPYCSLSTLKHHVPPDPDYFYNAAYYRLGGTEDMKDPNDWCLLEDANAWYNLVYGTDWDGTDGERAAICDILGLTGADRTKEENRQTMPEALSLLNYLAEHCGADKVTAYCFDACTFEEAFGMDYATARAEWIQSLMERFGDGSEEP